MQALLANQCNSLTGLVPLLLGPPAQPFSPGYSRWLPVLQRCSTTRVSDVSDTPHTNTQTPACVCPQDTLLAEARQQQVSCPEHGVKLLRGLPCEQMVGASMPARHIV